MDVFCGSPFWDINLIWNTTNPDFPECFQKTILMTGPCVILWILLPLAVVRVKRSPRFHIPWTGLNISKIVLSIILIVANAIILAYNASRIKSKFIFSVDLVYPTIEWCTYILVLIMDITHRKKGIHSSVILFIFWLLKTFGEIIIFRSTLLRGFAEESEISTTIFAMRIVIFPLIAAQFMLNVFADTVISSCKTQQPPCPKKMSSPLAVAYYTYFDGLAWAGFKRNLLNNDLWSLDNIYKCSDVYSEFDAHWSNERQRRAKNSFPSVLKIVWQMNRSEFILAILIKYIGDLLGFVNPLMLRQLINFVSSDEPMWKGYLYAVTIFVSSSMASLCMNNHFYRMQQIGMRARAAVISAIYRKALRLSNSAKKTSTVGEIVNLMSVDAQKIMDVWQYVGHGFSMPLQVGLALYFLWDLLGYAVFVGAVVIILMIPINAFLAGKTSKIQVQLMRYKDQRTKLMTEILGGIKVLKLYAWEVPFYDLVKKVRKAELRSLKKILYLQAVTTFLFQCTPFLISLSTFATYVLVDPNNILDATTAFVSLSLFDIMRVPLNFVPMVVAIVVQAHVSISRIDKFMRSDEIDPNVVTNDLTEEDPVVVENATFTWGDEEPILRDITFRVPHGKLVAVVGTVGSGKSSLISAILGEMDKTQGRVNTQGQIAYVSQQAWIQNATLKNNILFEKRYYTDKYNAIVDACALRQDLDILPGGDQTEIGEKGINLSGGQKQRVSLARAIYSDADVYLFDDPLSAVDSHVGKHIFDNVIGPKGLLSHKTRVLVTHGIAYLPHMDTIVVLSNGRISEMGTYKELLRKGGEFAEFIMTYLKDEESLSDVEMAELIEMQDEILTEIKDEQVKRRLSERITKALSSDDEAYISPGSNKIRKRKRTLTSRSISEIEPPKPSVAAKLTQQEQMEIGTVDWDVYTHYIKSIGYVLFVVSIAILALGWSASVGSNIWLSIWSTDQPLSNGMQNTDLRNLRLGVYGALGFTQAIFAFVASITLACATIRASKLLHNTMLSRVFHSPMSFFDTTPLGRIVNRFSRDVDVTDVSIPTFLRPVLDCFFQIIGTVVVISLGSPIFLAIFFPLMIFYYLIQRLYIDVSRQLKRLESVSRSPIYSHFSETLSGLPTVRAFQKQDSFILKLEETVDYNHILYYPILVAKRWLGIRLDAIGEIIVLAAGLFAVIGRGTMDPGTVGLSVSYAMSITFILMWLVRNWTDLETNIVSVERMKEYMEIDMEAPWELKGVHLAPEWPQNGEVHFEKYSTCYREGLDLVLRGISGHILSREKIGIVGRTGAGKSSLTLALFRIIEATDGFISIDGVNINRIGLHDLRSRLTIIPQDPVLFFGSLRMNLDPFSKYSDDDIWRALALSHLKEFVVSLPAGLEHEIVEGGENLSVGQRQLVCLARALLRKTKVLILDEATAAVDLETDDLIQATIRKEFADCTIITIAHRLNTIMDSNRVMVLQNGNISEFDPPSVLLQRRDSIFYSMAKDAGLV